MGKARSFSDNSNDTVYQSETNSENYNLSQQNSYGLGGGVFNDQSGIGNFSQAGSDQRKASLQGALFLGNLGFDVKTAELDVGTFTIDLNNDNIGTVLSVIPVDRIVTLSAGTTSDLTTITGAQRPGQRLRLYNTAGNTITIKNTASTVNTILTPNGTDFAFFSSMVIDLVFDAELSPSQWKIVTGVSGGSGGTGSQTPWLSDIDAAGFSLNNLLSVDIEDSAGATKLGISGPLGVGARFSFISGDTVFFTENITDRLSIDASGLNVFAGSILDVDFIESAVVNLPGSGFIRMGTGEEIRLRNPSNDDDLIITSGNDALSNQAILFQVASGDRLTVSQFDIDVLQNDIINTGDVLPSGTGGEVGDATNFYNQMHAQFFVPEASAVVINRFALAKTGNELYVNFDDTNIDAGFAIREQGLQRFKFSRFGSTPFVNEFFIGGDPFLAGEEYRIQLGENSNASGRIFFIEGTGNDLILDRAGAGIDQGVQIRGAGLSIARFLSDRIKIFQDIDGNSQNINSIKNIFSDDTTNQIGDLTTGLLPGGFDYYVSDKIFWDTDPATFIQFQTNGIFIESDDDVSILAPNATSDVTIRAGTGSSFFNLGLSGINHLQFTSGVTQFSTANIFLATGTEFIGFLDAASGATLDTPVAGDINLFNDSDTGELSVKKFGGTVVSLEGGSSPLTTKGDIFGFDTVDARIPVGADALPLVADSTVALGVGYEILKIAGGGTGQSVYAEGDILFGQSGGNNLGKLAIGGVNTFLNGGTVPSWSTIELTQLSDVNLTSPSVGNVLTFNGSLWINQAPSAGASDGLQDFEIWQEQDTTQFEHDVYMTNSKSGTTADGGTGAGLTQDVGWWVPIYLAKRSRIIRMGLEITGGASGSSNVVMGIYSNRTDGQNYPETKQVQGSTFLSNTASAQTVFVSATNLEAGLYWLVVASTTGDLDCVFTLEGESNCVGYQLDTVGTDHFDAILGYVSTQTTTTLPTTAPNNMDIANTLGFGAPLVFAIFNANTS